MAILSLPAAAFLAVLSFGCTNAAMAATEQAPLGQAVPAQPPIPGEDPARVQMEEQLKDLQRRENDTQDLREKERLLNGIIEYCIELGRDYAAYQQRLAEVKQKLAQENQKASAQVIRERQNRALKDSAIRALTADPPRLSDAARDLDASLRLFPRDAETIAYRARVTSELRNQLVRRVALVILTSFGALALLIPLTKGLWKNVSGRELEMVEGPQPGEVFKLAKDTTRVGAVAAESDIVIADPFRKISRRHCEISRSGKHYFLTDCSTNGTEINGKPAPKGEPVLLRKGDRIALADDVVLRFR
jgi:predicted component of type VI protein secretion system